MSKDTLAIIPARGGSKGVLRKNVLPLAGKPLIGWTIEAALGAACVDRVVVSTDDPEIAQVSERFGADVVWRPAEISGDMASSEAALLHTIEHLREAEDYEPELIVFLQCTSPLTAPIDVDGTVGKLRENAADTALAVIDFHYFLWEQNDDDFVGINHDKSVRLLRQEKPPQFLETGAVYAMRTAGFLEAKHRFFGKTAHYVMPPERRLEIDDPVDFKVAETLLRERLRQSQRDRLPEHIDAVVLDFDGVLTDNRVEVHQDGNESVTCDRGDGWGLSRLKDAGIPILVLSSEVNQVVSARCQKLGIDCVHGMRDAGNGDTKTDGADGSGTVPRGDRDAVEWKGAVLGGEVVKRGWDLADVIFVGNDENDLECLGMVGCAVVPADAHSSVMASADIVLAACGGYGAVRELADMILEREGG